MKFIKAIALSALLAISAPFTANAANLFTENFTFNSTTDVFFFLELFGPAAPANGISPTAGDTATINVTNNLQAGTDLSVTAGLPASVNPADGFVPATVFSWAGDADVALDNADISTVIAFGATDTLTITFGTLAKPFTNLDVRFNAVPLPAGFLLLLTALGGMGFVARRRAAAAAV